MSPSQVTLLLQAARGGDPAALERLLPLVYDTLHDIARRCRRGEYGPRTMRTTDLVHEAYLRLVHLDGIAVQDRAHFLALAARQMRRILIDAARRRQVRQRHAVHPDTLADALVVDEATEDDLLALDDALTRLASESPRLGQIVELRFYGGLSIEETAEVLGMGTATVKRDWQKARAWLYAELVA